MDFPSGIEFERLLEIKLTEKTESLVLYPLYFYKASQEFSGNEDIDILLNNFKLGNK
jgi:hypothetical protein